MKYPTLFDALSLIGSYGVANFFSQAVRGPYGKITALELTVHQGFAILVAWLLWH